MTPRRFEQLLWIATGLVATVGAGGTIVMQLTQSDGVAAVARPIVASSGTWSRQTNSGDQLRGILDGNLFRRERSAPDSVPTPPPHSGPPKPPPPAKPRLILRGLVGGPPWNAILDGVPGHDGGYVVRAGDSVGGLKVRAVRSDGATIRGMDTTWNLKLGRAP